MGPSRVGRIAVAGSSGFIGSAVSEELAREGLAVVRLPPLRLPTGRRWTPDEAARWIDKGSEPVDALRRAMAGCAAVVNCAGRAEPSSADVPGLDAANVGVPLVLYALARANGCGRFVQVSSAAVQGRRAVLDESHDVAPFSAYSSSKARAERHLLEEEGATQVVVYRATSVQGRGRSTTRQLVRFAHLPRVPVVAPGTQPLPVSLVRNTAAAVSWLARQPTIERRIYLHPWEGITARSLVDLLNPSARVVDIPRRLVAGPLRLAASARLPGGVQAKARLVDLLVNGQQQDATSLMTAGFRPPVGPDGYRDLSREAAVA